MAMQSVPVAMAPAAAVTACAALARIMFGAMAFARAGADSASSGAATAPAGAAASSATTPTGPAVAVKAGHASGDDGRPDSPFSGRGRPSVGHESAFRDLALPEVLVLRRAGVLISMITPGGGST
jgi:hypothetical protein